MLKNVVFIGLITLAGLAHAMEVKAYSWLKVLSQTQGDYVKDAAYFIDHSHIGSCMQGPVWLKREKSLIESKPCIELVCNWVKTKECIGHHDCTGLYEVSFYDADGKKIQTKKLLEYEEAKRFTDYKSFGNYEAQAAFEQLDPVVLNKIEKINIEDSGAVRRIVESMPTLVRSYEISFMDKNGRVVYKWDDFTGSETEKEFNELKNILPHGDFSSMKFSDIQKVFNVYIDAAKKKDKGSDPYDADWESDEKKSSSFKSKVLVFALGVIGVYAGYKLYKYLKETNNNKEKHN